MNKSHFCVGIDVGKDELVVSVEQGRPGVFGTSISEIKRLELWVLQQAGERQVHIGIEVTGVYGSRCCR